MAARYRFLDRWFVPAPVEEVYDILGDQLSYPTWWGDSFLEVTGDEGPPRPGRRASVIARGFLPYRIRWQAEIVDCERPRRFELALSGDFVGSGGWRLEEVGGGTKAELDWRPGVEKPLVKYLTPLLRPLFRWNHAWAMRRGQEGILRLLEQRRRSDSEQALEARPEPVPPVG